MRKLFFSLLIFVFSLGIIAISIEVFVRYGVDNGLDYDLEMWKYATRAKRIAADPQIGHEHIPGAKVYVMGTDVEINSKGLRDREFPYERPSGRTRILMLGDSITFGWGVTCEETSSKRLERLLKEQGFDVEVINTGIGNTNTEMQVAYFMTEGYKYNSDIVILNYFINDAEPRPAYHTIGFLQRYSYANTYLRGRIDVLLRMLSDRPDWKTYYRNLYRAGGHWAQASAAIDQLAKFSHDRRFQLMIVNYPELRELEPYPFVEVSALIRAAAERNELPYLDLLSSVQGQPPSSLWVTQADSHANGRANAFFAEAIAEWIRPFL